LADGGVVIRLGGHVQRPGAEVLAAAAAGAVLCVGNLQPGDALVRQGADAAPEEAFTVTRKNRLSDSGCTCLSRRHREMGQALLACLRDGRHPHHPPRAAVAQTSCPHSEEKTAPRREARAGQSWVRVNRGNRAIPCQTCDLWKSASPEMLYISGISSSPRSHAQ
jgi:hypothetical protein